MRTWLRGKTTLLFMTFALLLAIPAVALADQLRDTLDTSQSVQTITAGDANGFTNNYYVFAQGPDGCDVSSTTPAKFEILVPDGVTASPTELTFTQCSTQNNPPNNTQSVKFTSNTVNTDGYSIGARQISGPAMNVNNAEFTLKVNAAPVTNTKPVLSLPNGINATATSSSGTVVNYTATATDEEDGDLTSAVECKPASGSTFPLGPTKVECSVEDSGGLKDIGIFQVNVTYGVAGILQPINGGLTLGEHSDDNSAFKLGSTAPVKFQLSGASAGIENATANLKITKVNNGILDDAETEAITSTPASTGSLFRYDATSGQYIYNWGTKGQKTGTYQLRLDLGDGNGSHTVWISLK